MGNRNAQIVVLVVLLLLLLTAIGVLITGYLDIDSELQAAQKEAVSLQNELDELDDYIMEFGVLIQDKKVEVEEKSTQLRELYARINDLELELNRLAAEGKLKDKTIAELENRLKDAKASLFDQSKTTVPNLLSVITQLERTIDTVYTSDLSIAQDGSNEVDRSAEIEQLRLTIKRLNDNLSLVNSLRASDFEFMNVSKANGDGSIPELRFKQVAMNELKLCFTIPYNPLAPIGPRTIYMILTSPDLLPSTNFSDNLSGNDLINGQQKTYSVKKSITYDRKEQEVCLFYKPDKAWQVGKQDIQIYCDNEIIGKTVFEIID